MSEDTLPIHYVCSHEEASGLIQAHDRFWVSNCGCREGRGGCARSRVDVCLSFAESDAGSGSGKKEIPRADGEAILQEAEAKHHVARPFRNEARTATDGICFCCDDCCGYFRDAQYKCDKGQLIEETDLDRCDFCGVCAGVCYFRARRLQDDELTIERDNCYGCGLCLEVCPLDCIRLVPRQRA